jgi:hypothetical protein
MDYSFSHYLLAKQTVDDRALNRPVYERLVAELASVGPSPKPAFSVVEVGAGIGTMLVRLLRWNLLPVSTEYILVDEMPENIVFAREWLPRWGREHGWRVEPAGDVLRFYASDSAPVSVSVRLVQADVFDFIWQKPQPSDLLIAHAFLDLLPMPASLTGLFGLLKPGGLAWLTINFDGVTSLEPALDPRLDAQIEQLYHQTMDRRPTGGDSQSGRHLFGHVQAAGGEVLAAGASDWVVFPSNGKYPAAEAYFLHFILHFFELSLGAHPELDAAAFETWLAARRGQIERGELIYIAHQMDFLARSVLVHETAGSVIRMTDTE